MWLLGSARTDVAFLGTMTVVLNISCLGIIVPTVERFTWNYLEMVLWPSQNSWAAATVPPWHCVNTHTLMLKTSQNICLYGGAQLMISQLHLISSIWVITVLMGAVREYRPLILHSGFKLFCVVVHLRLFFYLMFLFMKPCVQGMRTITPKTPKHPSPSLSMFLFNSFKL